MPHKFSDLKSDQTSLGVLDQVKPTHFVLFPFLHNLLASNIVNPLKRGATRLEISTVIGKYGTTLGVTWEFSTDYLVWNLETGVSPRKWGGQKKLQKMDTKAKKKQAENSSLMRQDGKRTISGEFCSLSKCSQKYNRKMEQRQTCFNPLTICLCCWGILSEP